MIVSPSPSDFIIGVFENRSFFREGQARLRSSLEGGDGLTGGGCFAADRGVEHDEADRSVARLERSELRVCRTITTGERPGDVSCLPKVKVVKVKKCDAYRDVRLGSVGVGDGGVVGRRSCVKNCQSKV